ncbi:exo-alpha-sialidase [uncultured Duncaniella sp.]|uniref:MGH1-like glycoside hydrolase domain-containing protein n=1 Tax=uncultured Duncaniella sp. TaxID=2768039 RepID=UPI0025F5DCDE|nr:exo-alpha-sialidase [uncultured Duncaniella sp.]
MNNTSRIMIIGAALAASVFAGAEDLIHYTGDKLSNPNRHDGGLSPVVGVHNIQTMRANRRYDLYHQNENGWTYNHQPMMAYWNGKFYMHYLSNPVDEHVGAGRTLLQTSDDGYNWTAPEVLFPVYPVPDGFTKDGVDGVAKNLDAVMHQRVGFYVSKSGRLLAIGNYGIALHPKDDPNDGNGIGRVVREILPDGTFGPIYFIYYNHDFNEKNTIYPNFRKSKDKGFREACQEILDNPLYRMQMVEEADRNDPMLPLKNPYKAFCWYTLPNGDIASLWKHALTSVSKDGGNTWYEPVNRAKGFVNSNAKIWGQKLSDGTYATVYNPSEYRWPLGISLSSDGLNYTTLNLVHGEVPPIRYAGQYKSYGPQYVRGIQEGNGTPEDGDLWLTYSVGKEDMWVARVPVPVQTVATAHANDNFADFGKLSDLTMWNIYSPVWAPVSLEKKDGNTWLTLADKDPFDVSKVERKIPPTRELSVEFDIVAEQNDHGNLLIEFVDDEGTACARLDLTPDGEFRSKGGARYGKILNYEPGKPYHVKVDLTLDNRNSTVYVNGEKKATRMLFAPVKAVERVVFRTGDHSSFPNVDTEADSYNDNPRANDVDREAKFRIANFKTSSRDADASAAVLRYNDYAPYVDYFNNMEDENIVQAIPNSESSAWMKENIPLFDCPDKDMEEMYYYRWWTLRKHIKNTPVGYGMTEFLVDRNYADKYNLIACAIGHHIYESRWLRDQKYLDGIINTWYHGNEGKPMNKMMKFSSWNPDAVYGRYLVNGDLKRLEKMYPDLKAEYARWEESNRLPSGLYWQRDVADGMEESISGGRRTRNARPSINSYMYGNAKALAAIAEKLGKNDEKAYYEAKAKEMKDLVQSRLWSDEQQFFETERGDTICMAREAIGYIPWYFNLPDSGKYDAAWLQLNDEKGFSAPYGLTTAERRHPEFRTRGVGKCEWDGAIWPFASAQTLTALANYLNSEEKPVVSDSTYFAQMKLYEESQHHRGRPYIGEYLDEVTGYWLKGDQERSRYYNHSTFNDLVITGICGLRPQDGNDVVVNPLLPDGTWDWFALDNVPYHGHNVTIIWDKDGSRYHHGKGLTVMVDGKIAGNRPDLGKLVCKNVL